MDKIKILVVGDSASIHTGRFVALLQEIGYDVKVFQSEFFYSQEEHLCNTVLHVAVTYATPANGNQLKSHYWILNPLVRLLTRKPLISRLFAVAFHRYSGKIQMMRANHLAKLIKRWQPEIVFSLKMQNDGYTMCKARKLLGNGWKSKWVHFNWGTDIEFFGKNPAYAPKHLPLIRELLSTCDYHIADCKRDARQAAEFGFRGVSLGDCLAPGGFDLKYLEDIKSENMKSERNIILIKGRQEGLVGKAYNVLAALHRIPHLLKNYQIKIVMATPEAIHVADFLTKIDGINYEIMPRLPYRELLDLFGRSRIAISASDVDGTPSFLIESMSMGALPIHSDMESVREWVEHGINGLLFPVDDISTLTHCIEESLQNNALVDSARIKNWVIATDRMDRQKIKLHIKDLIENSILT